ncbi:hypothetical protein RND81_06G116100 [Saponaria officinalis]|uniref:Bromo domain-containing protein n=1 Tax=Saponaria officinalis TaxID=3572 RepID=A0AAW1KCE8_SAPOF
MVDEEGGDDRVRWGTWEELILGGAVLRHGSQNWDVVAKEVQTRTLTPYLFSSQVCKAKYDALQERYSGCSAWFEDLRKRRVQELRRALEMSDDSIGSLESKLVSLKTEKGGSNYAGYSCSIASTPVPILRSGCNESSGKEASKDGSSAGSFTHEIGTSWSKQRQAVETEKKPLVVEPSRLEKFPSVDELAETMLIGHGVSIKGRRGKRRRKDPREGIVGENHVIPSPDITTTSHPSITHGTTGFKKRRKEPSKNDLIPSADVVIKSQGTEKRTSGSGYPSRVTDANDVGPCTSKQGGDDFTTLLESIMENEHASVFRRRLDSQKRARYRSIVRQHMDLDTIRSRIANKSIKSVVELLRDLLLVANNALIFYCRITREYKCALVLRDLVTKRLHQYYNEVGRKVVSAQTPKSPVIKPPAKPRSARPFNRKPGNKESSGGNNNVVGVPKESKHISCIVGSPSSAESSALTKKCPSRRGKVGRVKRGNAGIQAETPMKVRKKVKDKLEKL